MSSHFELDPVAYEMRREGHMQQRRLAIVSSTIARDSKRGDTVLELGCGPGALLARLARTWPDRTFVGMDVEETMVEHARASHAASNLMFKRVDLRLDIGVTGASVAFGVDVVHHIDDLDALTAAMRRALEPRGVWVVIEPNSLNPYIAFSQERMKRRGLEEDHFRPRALEHALRRNGFVVEQKRTAFVFPGAVQRVPSALVSAERVLERLPFVGGSVVYRIRMV